MPVVGQGTWPVPERDALRRGITLGMTHIDTAEMYGDGRSEEIVGEAIAPFPRDSLFVVSKVLPSNATSDGIVRACERSLRRLRTDYLDCYLLHWRGGVPLEETMSGLEQLADQGKIRSLGVSNLDPWDLREAAAGRRTRRIACDQVLYNLAERTPEDHELTWAREHGCALVAYTPLARPSSAEGERVLQSIARAHDVTLEAVALAFLLRSARVRHSQSQPPRARRSERPCRRIGIARPRARRARRGLPQARTARPAADELAAR